MATVIQVKRGTASSWTSANTLLAAGEIGFETDTRKTKVGDGSTAWNSLSYTVTDGDITEVVAGTGLSGGSTSGSATLTNSMATAIDAKADLIVGTGADTFDRLAVGANNTVLTADSSVSPTGLKWAAPAAGGGLTLLATASPSAAASFNFTSISGSYKNLLMYWQDFSASAGGTFATMKLNNDSGANYEFQTLRIKSQATNIAVDAVDNSSQTSMMGGTSQNNAFGGQFAGSATQTVGRGWLRIWNYTNTTYTFYDWHSKSYDNTVPNQIQTIGWGGYDNSTAINRIDVTASGGTLSGTCYLYGES
jgi:hypothetical protein